MFCTVFFSYLLVVSLQIRIRILTYLHLHTHSLSQEDAYSNKDSILRLLESLKFPDHLQWLLSLSATMPLVVSFPNLNWVSPSLTVAVKLACPVLTEPLSDWAEGGWDLGGIDPTTISQTTTVLICIEAIFKNKCFSYYS